MGVGTDGYLRKSVPSDVTPACTADTACATAALRTSELMLVDGLHPTRAGASALCPLVQDT